MWLTIVFGDDAGTRVEVGGERFVLGRVRGSDLVVRDPQASREHASLRELPDGALALEDLASANGTLVDGRPVRSAVLHGGERLRIGHTLLAVTPDEPSDAAVEELVEAARAAEAPPPTPSAIQRLVLQRSVRRATLVGGAAVALAAVALGLLVSGTFTGGGREDVAKAVDAVAPSTVFVEAQVDGQRTSTGSGWVLDGDEGLVVTSAHVVNRGSAFRVGAAGRLRPARVVGAAPCEDLAVLSVSDRAGLRTLPLGDQSKLEEGETVVAVGYPGSASLGDDLVSTTGVVSVARTAFRETAPDVPRYPDVIQTDAALNPGSSGGPLADLDGRLVGVNSAVRTEGAGGRVIQGQGYAIGVDRVKRVLPELARGNSLDWTGLGFDYPKVSELAERELPAGLVISRAVSGTPAERSRLAERSALLVGVDGRAVQSTLASYCDAVGGTRSGGAMTLSVIEPGRRSAREVTLRLP